MDYHTNVISAILFGRIKPKKLNLHNSEYSWDGSKILIGGYKQLMIQELLIKACLHSDKKVELLPMKDQLKAK